MNYRLILYFLGIVSLFIGASMAFALPWALPAFGGDWATERAGFLGLVLSMLAAFGAGAVFYFQGQKIDKQLLRKESMAVVPLSWIFAILLGALPFWISGTELRVGEPMTFIDAVFESTSGLTTTGATVLSNVENPQMIPRTILFWRATTHFLGGLGIMVLFVVILGQGVTGKTIMKIEKGSGSSGTSGRIRQMALALTGVYIGLIAVETVLLTLLGLSVFDALCHSFSTLATGGFSTYNASIGHFAAETGLNAGLIEGVITVFMILAGSNFILLFYCFMGKPDKLFKDVEWRVYLGVIIAATAVIFLTGIIAKDFDVFGTSDSPIAASDSLSWPTALRQSIFQVVSILTSTGFCTDEYEKWNSVALLTILLLMFLGGCAGSTAGGTKIIRSIVAFKTIRQEIEHTYRPNIVRTIKVGETMIDKQAASSTATFLLLFGASVFLITFVVLLLEPGSAWEATGRNTADRTLDVFSASLLMHSNVGLGGFGLIGARDNFGFFTQPVKLIFSWAMLLGRLELFLPLLLFSPSFWRKQ